MTQITFFLFWWLIKFYIVFDQRGSWLQQLKSLSIQLFMQPIEISVESVLPSSQIKQKQMKSVVSNIFQQIKFSLFNLLEKKLFRGLLFIIIERTELFLLHLNRIHFREKVNLHLTKKFYSWCRYYHCFVFLSTLHTPYFSIAFYNVTTTDNIFDTQVLIF